MLQSALNKLDVIQTNLDQITTKLDLAGLQLSKIVAQSAFANLESNRGKFNDELKYLKQIVARYKALLRPGYGLQTYADLNSYMNSLKGGFNSDSYAKDGSLAVLLDIRKTLDSYYRLVEQARVVQMSTSLRNLCLDQKTIYGDIIARRTECNVVAGSIISDTAAITAEISAIVVDAMSAIDAQFVAAQSANNTDQLQFLRSTLANTEEAGQTWSYSRQKVIDNMLAGLNRLSEEMLTAIVTPTLGLSESLLKSLVDARCSRSVGGQAVAGIESWFISDPVSGSTVKPSPYLVTQCSRWVGVSGDTYSRFHYDTDAASDGKMINLLGVTAKADAISRSVSWSTDNSKGVTVGQSDHSASSAAYEWVLMTPRLTFTEDPSGGGNVPLLQIAVYNSPVDPPVRFGTYDDYDYPDGSFLLRSLEGSQRPRDGSWPTKDSTAPVKIGHLWSRLNQNSNTNPYKAIIAYTWVTDPVGWASNPMDRRYTRTVLYRLSQYRWFQGSSWFNVFWADCITADCSVETVTPDERPVGVGLRYEGGPTFKWADSILGPGDSLGGFDMFINGVSGKGRTYPGQ